ncbi:MAG: lysylphosphatidylglycerol synthase transmembrane domain-containing protein [Myxococcota bacterium]|nr:lysylphosphatidylglycerol synthase transmembrane domain-containing protein [Myxococcota bacterium]
MTEIDATPTQQRRRWAADWRVWLGVAITVACLWYVAEGVPLAEVAAAFARADIWLLVGVSVPAHVLGIYVRALRWRHLTNPIAPMTRGLLYRAQSIGFLVNNLVPLRMGEFVRAWFLARESQTRGAAVLGTIVLERTLDIVSVLLMAGVSVAVLGATAGDGQLVRGAQLMLLGALVPVAGIAALRFAPASVLRVVGWVTRPLPDRIVELVGGNLERFTQGLGAISGGAHLFWIAMHSVVIWLILGVLPMISGIVAFGIDLGGPGRLLMTSWLLLAAVGVAVAIPSAPGFFGTYQLAFVAVLEPLGVNRATCLALGLLVWFVFWCSFTFQGLIVMRLGGTSLAELTAVSSKDPTTDRR